MSNFKVGDIVKFQGKSGLERVIGIDEYGRIRGMYLKSDGTNDYESYFYVDSDNYTLITSQGKEWDE